MQYAISSRVIAHTTHTSVTDSNIANIGFTFYIKGVPVISPATEKISLKILIAINVKVQKMTIVKTVVMTTSKAARPFRARRRPPVFLSLSFIVSSTLVNAR